MDFKINAKLALCATMILFFVAQIVIISNNEALFWDESVYIGMGKYIFSSGSSGLWEPIRPLFLPLIAGTFWATGLNPIIYGRLLAATLSIGSIFLTYTIAKKIFEKTEAIIAAALLATAPLFFGFASFFLTDISSTFFALLSMYFFISYPESQKHLFFSGLLLGIAFLTRFPQIIVFISVLLFLAFVNRGSYKNNSKEITKRALIIILGFTAVSFPYFAFNHISYGTAIEPLINAQLTVAQESTGFYIGNYAYYFMHLTEQNFLPILWIIGILLLLTKKRLDQKTQPIILASLLLITYITFVPHKELRYILIAMPLMAIIAAYPLAMLLKKVRIDFKPIAGILTAYLAIIAYMHIGYVTGFFEQTNKTPAEKEMADRILSFENNAPVYSSTPLIAAYIDNPIIVNYYTPESFAEQSLASENAYIAVATCAFPCNKGDRACEKRNRDMLDKIASKSTLLWNKNTTKCEYYLFGVSGRSG